MASPWKGWSLWLQQCFKGIIIFLLLFLLFICVTFITDKKVHHQYHHHAPPPPPPPPLPPQPSPFKMVSYGGFQSQESAIATDIFEAVPSWCEPWLQLTTLIATYAKFLDENNLNTKELAVKYCTLDWGQVDIPFWLIQLKLVEQMRNSPNYPRQV